MKNKIEFVSDKPQKQFIAYESCSGFYDLYVEGLLIKRNISNENLIKLINILK